MFSHGKFMKGFCVWCKEIHEHFGNIGQCTKKGGEKLMAKMVDKKKKTAHERFSLKVDKLISTLIQMKPIADSPHEKEFVYSNLKSCLIFAEELASQTE